MTAIFIAHIYSKVNSGLSGTPGSHGSVCTKKGREPVTGSVPLGRCFRKCLDWVRASVAKYVRARSVV